VVFNTFAERRLGELVPGARLTHAQVHDVHGLLAGSPVAQQALAHDAPTLARRLQGVANETFVAGLRGAMIVTAMVCLIGVAAALATRGTRAPTPGRRRSDRSYSGSPPVAAAVDPESW
jgi:hypothetical protein